MGANEVEVVRAFCVFVRLKAAAAPQPEGTWRSMVDHEVAALVKGAESATPEALRSMIETGRTVEKMQRGMAACAIATPNGPVMVGVDHGSGLGGWGSGITVTPPDGSPVKIHGILWPDAAEALYEALVAAGGPIEPLCPATMTAADCDAVARGIVEKLRAGDSRASLPEHDIEVVWEPRGWVITKGEGGPVLAAHDAWDLLRSDLARMLAE